MKIKPISSQELWEKFVTADSTANFLHSWNWGEVLKLEGHQIHRLGLYDKNKLTGVCLAVEIYARRGHFLLVPGGPLINWSSSQAWQTLNSHLMTIAKKHHLHYLKLRSQLPDTPSNRKIFFNAGYRLSHQHFTADNSWVLPFQGQTPASLMQAMRKNTRSAIKKGLKLNLTVKKSCSQTDLDELIRLDKETSQRQKFVNYPSSYYRHIHEVLAPAGQLSYYKIYNSQNQLLVINLIIHYHRESVYYISGSSLAARKLPAAPTLIWHILTTRLNRDDRFNFWGVAPPGSLRHRYQGVTTFKRGFGGHALNYVPAMELPLSWRYWCTYVYESIMKRAKKL